MSFLAILALAIIIFYIIYILLWATLDCNVALFFKEKFGDRVSKMKGQVVWITGASSGIGRGLANALAPHGVKLVLSARRLELLNSVKEECLKKSNGLLTNKDILVLQMDMLDNESHEQCLKTVLQNFGHLDVLVNNAGRSQRAAWEDIEVKVDRELFELDVFSLMHLSRLVVRYFLKEAGGHGHIAATSSIAGLGPVPFSATYCAAKSALNAYLNCLRMEHPLIDVTIFAPGPVATNFLQEAFTAVPDEKVGKSTANQKRVTAERCGELFAVSIANKMDLTWCGLFPVNILVYCMRYIRLGKIVNKLMGRSTVTKIREGKL